MTTRLRIYGVVQGVGYRASFEQQARVLGVSGWVRNRRDGSVEALVKGNAEALQALIAWAHRGPALARVDRVDIVEETVPGETIAAGRFEIRPTV